MADDAGTKLRHQRERDNHREDWKEKKAKRRHLHEGDRNDELAKARKHGAAPARSEHQYLQDRARDLSAMDGEERASYKAMTARHAEELKNGVEVQAGRGDEYRAAHPKHQAEMDKMRDRHAAEAKAVDDAHTKDKSVFGRYSHQRTTEAMDHGHQRDRERMAERHRTEISAAKARHVRDKEAEDRKAVRHHQERMSLSERQQHESESP